MARKHYNRITTPPLAYAFLALHRLVRALVSVWTGVSAGEDSGMVFEGYLPASVRNQMVTNQHGADITSIIGSTLGLDETQGRVRITMQCPAYAPRSNSAYIYRVMPEICITIHPRSGGLGFFQVPCRG